MSVKQISVFLENRKGRLLAVTQCLKEHHINIRALSLADTSDFGILRLIVDRPDEALTTLKEAGFTVSSNRVIAIQVPDIPGGLNQVLQGFAEAQVNLEYAYAFCNSNQEFALYLFRVDKEEAAISQLKKMGIRALEEDEVYHI